jgi:hypothetical protein
MLTLIHHRHLTPTKSTSRVSTSSSSSSWLCLHCQDRSDKQIQGSVRQSVLWSFMESDHFIILPWRRDKDLNLYQAQCSSEETLGSLSVHDRDRWEESSRLLFIVRHNFCFTRVDDSLSLFFVWKSHGKKKERLVLWRLESKQNFLCSFDCSRVINDPSEGHFYYRWPKQTSNNSGRSVTITIPFETGSFLANRGEKVPPVLQHWFTIMQNTFWLNWAMDSFPTDVDYYRN